MIGTQEAVNAVFTSILKACHKKKKKKRMGVHFSSIHAKVKHYEDEPDPTRDGINRGMF